MPIGALEWFQSGWKKKVWALKNLSMPAGPTSLKLPKSSSLSIYQSKSLISPSYNTPLIFSSASTSECSVNLSSLWSVSTSSMCRSGCISFLPLKPKIFQISFGNCWKMKRSYAGGLSEIIADGAQLSSKFRGLMVVIFEIDCNKKTAVHFLAELIL